MGFQGEEIVCGLLPLNRISSDYCQSGVPLAHEKNFPLSAVSFYVVFSAIPQVHGKDLANYMSGIYWVAGARKGLKANDVELRINIFPWSIKL